MTPCGRDPRCLRSPLLCPIAMDSEAERMYERLRSELNAECGVPLGPMDYTWGGPARVAVVCEGGEDWLEGTPGGGLAPTVFEF